MTSTYRFVLIILIALVLCASAIAEDGVELPVEYYLGRWTPGHNFDGLIFKSSHSSTHGTGSYLYQRDNWRLGFSSLQKYVLVNLRSDPDTLETVNLYFHFRPARNLQIGIDELAFKRVKEHRIVSGVSPGYEEEFGTVFKLGLSSIWSNKPETRLNSGGAAFAYLGRKVLDDAHFILTKTLKITHNRSNDDGLSFQPRYTGEKHSASERYFWNMQSEFNWGVSDQVSLWASTGLRLWDSDERWASRWESGDSISSIHRESRNNRSYSPYYKIDLNVRPYKALMVSTRFAQTFSQAKTHATDQFISLDSLTDLDTVTAMPFQETSTNYVLSADWLLLGEFDPGVLLDDYNGFYRQMLFHRQLHVQATIERRKVGQASRPHSEQTLLSYRVAYGLLNHFEFSVAIMYPGKGFGLRSDSEQTVSRLKVRYRSYSYAPNLASSWYRNNPADILFGPVLKAGAVYLSTEYVNLEQSNSSTLWTQGTTQRINSNVGYLRGSHSILEAGLGLGTQIAVSSDLLFNSSEIAIHAYQLVISKRAWDKIDLSLGLSGLYVKAIPEKVLSDSGSGRSVRFAIPGTNESTISVRLRTII